MTKTKQYRPGPTGETIALYLVLRHSGGSSLVVAGALVRRRGWRLRASTRMGGTGDIGVKIPAALGGPLIITRPRVEVADWVVD